MANKELKMVCANRGNRRSRYCYPVKDMCIYCGQRRPIAKSGEDGGKRG